MILPPPDPQYSQVNEGETRRLITQAFGRTLKRGENITLQESQHLQIAGGSLIFTSPDGSEFELTVDDLGSFSTGGVSSFNTRTGAVTLTSLDVTGALTYTPLNAAAASFGGTAAGLTTARSITITGDASWTVNFDGTGNVSAALTLASSGVSAASYGSRFAIPSITFDAKGRATTASTNTTLAIESYNANLDDINPGLGGWAYHHCISPATNRPISNEGFCLTYNHPSNANIAHQLYFPRGIGSFYARAKLATWGAWQVMGDGPPGVQRRGDANASGGSGTTQYFDTPLTANRAYTAVLTAAYAGSKIRVVRAAAATGAFNLTVRNAAAATLKVLAAAGEWCDIEYDVSTADWVLTAYGAL